MTDEQLRGAFHLVLSITEGLEEEKSTEEFFTKITGKARTKSEEQLKGHKWRLETLAKYKIVIQEYIDAGKPEVDLNMSPKDISKVYDILRKG